MPFLNTSKFKHVVYSHRCGMVVPLSKLPPATPIFGVLPSTTLRKPMDIEAVTLAQFSPLENSEWAKPNILWDKYDPSLPDCGDKGDLD